MNEVPERLKEAVADRYTLDRELGRGGMATVYHARDLKHDRSVAVKVLRPELGVLLGVERFLREIKLVANLQHPHILPLYDSGEASGALYYVMPYVVGDSLRDRLRREHRLPLPDALRIAREVADALYYAHANGVIHRDIKPENILLSNGHAVVCDFGIARAIHAAGGGKWQTLTDSGIAIGTPAYMSPEQTFGEEEIDSRSDIYSLGCVFYEMLAGSPPGTGPDGEVMLARRFTHPPPMLHDLVPDIPETVNHAVAKALARDPADRFANAREFSEALWAEQAVTQPSARPKRPVAMQRSSSRRGWLAAFGIGALAVVAGVWLAMSAGKSRARSATIAAAEDTQLLPRPALDTQLGLPPATMGETTLTRKTRVPERIPAPKRQPASPAPRDPAASAPRLDSVLAGLRAAALRSRARGVENGASAAGLAAGDALFRDAETAANQGRLSDALSQFSSAAAVWAEAERAARAARDSQARRAEAVVTKPVADSAPPEPEAVDPRPAIRAVVAGYARAIESGSVTAIRQLYPGMTAAQQGAWEVFFATARNVKAQFEATQLDVTGSAAEVRVNGFYRYENTKTRRTVQEQVTFLASLRREGTNWRMTSIR